MTVAIGLTGRRFVVGGGTGDVGVEIVAALLASQKTLVIAVMPGTVDTTLAKDWPDPKVAPSEVARETVEAIENGVEDVYPGEQAKQISAQQLSDPKGVEKYMARFLPGKSLAEMNA